MSSDASVPTVGQAMPSEPSEGRVTQSAPSAQPVAPSQPAEGQNTPPASSTGQAAPSQPAAAPGTPSPQPTPANQGKREGRKSPRRRALKEGKVIFGKGHSVVDVTIDNVSEGGAHIRMLSSHGLPQEFYLCEASRGIIHRAEVAWRTATGMGLRLLGPLEDAAAREAFLRKFRRG